MKKKMSIAGVGPRFAIYSIVFSIVLFIIDNLTNPLFKINSIPHLYMLIAGIIFLIIGIPFFLLSAKTISKVYGQKNIYTLGVYSVCRHPLYSSFIFFIVPGIVFFLKSWILLVIPFVMYLIFRILIKKEEEYLKIEFGTQHTNYKNKVNLVFPKLWKFKSFIIIIGLVFLWSCSSNKEQNKLIGNWYSCANNGDYIEMFVKDNQYRYSANYGVITPWSQFKISDDTLMQFDKYIIEDTLIGCTTNLTKESS